MYFDHIATFKRLLIKYALNVKKSLYGADTMPDEQNNRQTHCGVSLPIVGKLHRFERDKYKIDFIGLV